MPFVWDDPRHARFFRGAPAVLRALRQASHRRGSAMSGAAAWWPAMHRLVLVVEGQDDEDDAPSADVRGAQRDAGAP